MASALIYVGNTVVSLVDTVGIAFVFLGAVDYLYQWWEYEKNLRMSKQEIKEEYKQTEGDPQIKGKIREKQRQMASRRMMQNVPNADVVIRNPTHFAVALGYDSGKNRAPVVLAKGADHLALKIVEVAEASGVYIMEDRPLARDSMIRWKLTWRFRRSIIRQWLRYLPLSINSRKRTCDCG